MLKINDNLRIKGNDKVQHTWSLLVEAIISLSPMQTPCLWSLWLDSNPLSKIGMISGRTFSPSFLTTSPSVRAATW